MRFLAPSRAAGCLGYSQCLSHPIPSGFIPKIQCLWAREGGGRERMHLLSRKVRPKAHDPVTTCHSKHEGHWTFTCLWDGLLVMFNAVPLGPCSWEPNISMSRWSTHTFTDTDNCLMYTAMSNIYIWLWLVELLLMLLYMYIYCKHWSSRDRRLSSWALRAYCLNIFIWIWIHKALTYCFI